MKIYSMTATFGKLEKQTLNLQPGLNIIEAPNEWGKSTWCAFLVSMLYGIDTKVRTTGTSLADKEHYAPWSGAPMEGRMDICWNGRDITIERRTKGRLIFGDFRAYETNTGLDVPELTAGNCGMELLGVERSVFVRAGFLRLTDMPVTQDDALRRRLNNLVTTGDESGDGEKLAQTLKDLKTKVKHNRTTGLIPQAESEQARLEEQLYQLEELHKRETGFKTRQQELEDWIAQLENHKLTLQYRQAKEKNQRITEAEQAYERLQAELSSLTAECAELPTESEAELAKAELQKLHGESMSLQMEQQLLPPIPEKKVYYKCFEGMTGEQAAQQAQTDTELAQKLKAKRPFMGIGLAVMVAAVLAAVAGIFVQFMFAVGGCLLVAGIVLVFLGIQQSKKAAAILQNLTAKYETDLITLWIPMAEGYSQNLREYALELEKYQAMVEQLRERTQALVTKLQTLTDGEPVGTCLDKWEQIINKWKRLNDLQRDIRRAEGQLEVLQSVSKDVPAPKAPDSLEQTMEETEALLINAQYELKQNHLRLGQCQGQAESIGQENVLREQLKQVRSRIEKLENTYAALDIALQALSSAKNELQRRFAPRIARRAEELFGKLTGGRYEKVILTDDLSLQISAQEETTLRSSMWRSDGTVDQLYLALRLAVAEELTPDAPLVLDDAMVRFDDDRLKTALHILTETAENKQVILFTCQTREKKLQGEA